MSVLLDAVTQECLGESLPDDGKRRFVSKKTLETIAQNMPIALRGKGRRKETAYFYKSARALAQKAAAAQSGGEPKVLAVLFRDADTTDRDIWQAKWDSIQRGFDAQEFKYGVPMLPQPISEAWLICALARRDASHKSCKSLESRSGRPAASKPPKQELKKILDGRDPGDALREALGTDLNRLDLLDMPSFQAFRRELCETLRRLLAGHPAPPTKRKNRRQDRR